MCTKVFCATAETQMRILQANPDIQQMWEAARCTNAKRGKSQWEMMYNKCSIHLSEDGVEIIINNPSGLVFTAYQQAVLKSLKNLGLGQKYAHAEFPEQVEGLRTHLTLVCRMMALTRFKHSVSTEMVIIDNDMPCILHLHKRLMEKILSLIMLKLLGEQEQKSARLRHGEKMSKIIMRMRLNAPMIQEPTVYLWMKIQGSWEKLNSMMSMQRMWRKLCLPSFQNF
jgi:hypothetical protein